MKRRTLKSIACAAVMALALSVTACGGSDDAANTNDAANTEENAENTEDAGEDSAADTEDTAADTSADSEDAAADTSVDSEDAAADTQADAPTDGAEGTYATLEDYYNDPSVKSALDASFESMSQEGMTLSIEAKENVLTMTCKFEDSSVVVDGIGDTLSAGLDANAAQFEQIAASFDEAVGGAAGTCTFAVRYTGPDDAVLAEKEFKAQ